MTKLIDNNKIREHCKNSKITQLNSIKIKIIIEQIKNQILKIKRSLLNVKEYKSDSSLEC